MLVPETRLLPFHWRFLRRCLLLRCSSPIRLGTLAVAVGMATLAPAEPAFKSPFLSYDTGGWPRSVAVGDLNEDGALDFVASNDGSVDGVFSNTVTVYFGRGDGSFYGRKDIDLGTRPGDVALGDMNSDGHLDIAVGGIQGGVAVLLGDGSGGFPGRLDR